MKRIVLSIIFSACVLSLPALAVRSATANPEIVSPEVVAAACEANQEGEEYPKEVYTGTLINMNGRTVSTGFNLTLIGRTSNEEAQKYLAALGNGGQDGLLKTIGKNDLGFIAATGQTRRDLLVVREAVINGKRRIIAAFERWMGFWEVRGGYRSEDYPFSIIEIFFDEKGRGTGTFIGLAQLKLERDKKTEQLRLEIESFGSFPAKVMGVMRRK